MMDYTNTNLIGYALRMAEKYYDEKTLRHALRVAAYVSDIETLIEDDKEEAVALAIMHDLLEDTTYNFDEWEYRDSFRDILNLITRYEGVGYMDYIKNINQKRYSYPSVYLVKLADIKDHLNQKKTLTESLKNRYVEALACLL